MTLIALIPVNRLDRAKGRLDGVLSADERRGLALATLATVVRAAKGAWLEPVVLTADETAREALAPGVRVIAESDNAEGLNAQLSLAISGMPEVLILHADLPLASAAELRVVVERAPTGPSITLVRSPDGGTNVMLLRSAGIELAYGADSWRKHAAAARRAGIASMTVSAPSLELDLDTPADLRTFMAMEGWEESEAGRFLAERGVPARLAEATPADHHR